MKAVALVALVAVAALGVGFYAGVQVGETHAARGPATKSISTRIGELSIYDEINTDSLCRGDFRELPWSGEHCNIDPRQVPGVLTSYGGRRPGR